MSDTVAHDLLTPGDVAALLKISRRQVHRLRDLPWRMLGPRTRRVTREDFDRWLDTRRFAA